MPYNQNMAKRRDDRPSEALRRAIDKARANGVTLYRVAVDADVGYATIHKFMAKERGISAQTLDKLAVYFGLRLKR